jgi:hypothetical protein
MYECEMYTKFRPEGWKVVSVLLEYGAASLSVKAEKFILKAGDCTRHKARAK